MIKNDNQLRRTERRCRELREIVADLRESYSGLQRRAMVSGFESELRERSEEIREYKRLLRLSLKEAIEGPLSENPMLLGNINEILAKLRIAAGLTQEEMAERLGWHQPNVSRFESEDYGGQTIASVVEYAGALDVWLYTAPAPSHRPPKIAWPVEEPVAGAAVDARVPAGTQLPAPDFEDTSAQVGESEPHWQQEDGVTRCLIPEGPQGHVGMIDWGP